MPSQFSASTYRGRTDSVALNSSYFDYPLNQGWTQPVGDKFRIRFGLITASAASTQFSLWFYTNRASAWIQVTTSSQYLRLAPSSHFNDADPTTDLFGIGDPFEPGEGITAASQSSIISIPAPNSGVASTELEWCLQFVTEDNIDNDSFEFAIFDGAQFTHYPTSPGRPILGTTQSEQLSGSTHGFTSASASLTVTSTALLAGSATAQVLAAANLSGWLDAQAQSTSQARVPAAHLTGWSTLSAASYNQAAVTPAILTLDSLQYADLAGSATAQTATSANLLPWAVLAGSASALASLSPATLTLETNTDADLAGSATARAAAAATLSAWSGLTANLAILPPQTHHELAWLSLAEAPKRVLGECGAPMVTTNTGPTDKQRIWWNRTPHFTEPPIPGANYYGNRYEQSNPPEYTSPQNCDARRGFKNLFARKCWHGSFGHTFPTSDGCSSAASPRQHRYLHATITGSATWYYKVVGDITIIHDYAASITRNRAIHKLSGRMSQTGSTTYKDDYFEDGVQLPNPSGEQRLIPDLAKFCNAIATCGLVNFPGNPPASWLGNWTQDQTPEYLEASNTESYGPFPYPSSGEFSTRRQSCSVTLTDYVPNVSPNSLRFEYSDAGAQRNADGSYAETAVTVDVTITFSELYTAEEVRSQVADLFNQWQLLNDAQYPWRQDNANCVIGPVVAYNETDYSNLLAFPPVSDPIDLPWTDGRKVLQSWLPEGSIIGKPLPPGFDPFWDFDVQGPSPYSSATLWDICSLDSNGGFSVFNEIIHNGFEVYVECAWLELITPNVPSHNWFRPCGDDISEWPEAWKICGRAAIASLTQDGSNILVELTEGKASHLVTGDSITISGVTGLNGAHSVTPISPSTFWIAGTVPVGYTSGGYVQSTGSPSYIWDTYEPRGDYALFTWERDFRDIHYHPELRPATGTLKTLVCHQLKSEALACGATVIAISRPIPNAPPGVAIVPLKSCPLDSLGGIWHAAIRRTMSDPLNVLPTARFEWVSAPPPGAPPLPEGARMLGCSDYIRRANANLPVNVECQEAGGCLDDWNREVPI